MSTEERIERREREASPSPSPSPAAISPPTDFMIVQTAWLYKRYALEARKLVGQIPVSKENRVAVLTAIVHSMMTYDALAAQILGVKPVDAPLTEEEARRYTDEPIL